MYLNRAIKKVFLWEHTLKYTSLNHARAWQVLSQTVPWLGSEEDYRKDGKEDSETKLKNREGYPVSAAAALSLILLFIYFTLYLGKQDHKLTEARC